MKLLDSSIFADTVKASPHLVLVDFFADWCGPCKAIAPLLEVWDELYPNLDIFKVDIDASFDLAKTFQISSVPTFKFFKKGECVYTQVGLLSASGLEAIIRTHLPQ